MSTPEEIVRRYFFEGRVQGVGFRVTAASIAKRYPVRGYVRNLPDGRVEMVAAGERSAIEQFLEEVDEEFRGYIEQRTSEDPGAIALSKGFEVRH